VKRTAFGARTATDEKKRMDYVCIKWNTKLQQRGKKGLCLYKMDQKYTKEDHKALKLKEGLILYLQY
jgi:hypothetical protein